VVSCNIYNIGAGGISLGGGDRKTLTPVGNYVRNCHIHHFNRLDRSYKSAVNIDGVGNRIEHCLIHDAPNSAIYLHGNDHLIEYNEVHHVCLDADDMGAFYMGRDPSEQGNILRYNFWHHIGNRHGNTLSIYFDDDSCGTEVYGNIVYSTLSSWGPVGINGGCDHIFHNNIFIENTATVPPGRVKRNYNWKTDTLQNKRLREDLDITLPPYSVRYPRLLESYSIERGANLGNEIWYNVSVNSGEFGEGTNSLKGNLVVNDDPGFVDLKNMNFQLRCDSIIYEKIPEFKKIPFEKIGLCKESPYDEVKDD
jgi:hypothetical protein